MEIEGKEEGEKGRKVGMEEGRRGNWKRERGKGEGGKERG